MTDQDLGQPEDHPDVAAGERALGLRPARTREREDVATLRWSEDLAPLFTLVPAVAPDTHVWQSVSARIDRLSRVGTVEGNALRRSMVRWRTTAAAGFALMAACLVALVGPFDMQSLLRGQTYVATLGPDNTTALFAAIYDPSRGTLTVAPMNGPIAGQQVPQLWFVPSGGNPVSLGLLDAGGKAEIKIQGGLPAYFKGGGALAISLEPAGGSPTGAPTGPVVAHGPLNALH